MKRIFPSSLHPLIFAAGAITSLSGVTSLQAQTTIDWLSTAPNGTWATGTNWVGTVAPANDTTSNIASFNSALYTTPTILPGTTSVAGLSIGASSAALTLSAGTLTVGSGNIAIASANATTSTTILAGAASLTKSGAGTLDLNVANTYSGGTTLSAGTLAVGNSAALGTGAINLSGGTIISSTTVGGDKTLTNASVVATAGTTTTVNAGFSAGNVGGNLSFNGALTGTGTLQTNGTQNRSVIYGGDLSGFQGTLSFTNVNNGNNLRVGMTAGVANLSNAKVELLGGTAGNRSFGTLDNTAGTIRIGELSGNGRALSTFGSLTNTFEIGNLNTNSTFSGLIGNNTGSTAAVTKVGTGTLTLSGVNTYTGATTINAGTLQMGATNVFSTGGFVLAGGTLDLNAFSDSVGTLTINTASVINFGATPGANSLTFTNSSAIAWTGNVSLLNFEVGLDTLKFGTSATGLTSGQLGQIILAGYTATGLDATGVVQFTVVPEPHEYALALSALLVGVIAMRRRALHAV